ncbi:MAG: acetate--CoA ligase family protein [Bacteroidales bacterium]|jgi:acetyltransferase|nr:acetate--CoA ligase family protein [Bacteroidales bacterium]
MITRQLTHPESIVVVGGSNDIQKPGGKILKNIIDGGFNGGLYVLNPKEDLVQGIKSYRNPEELPDVDLAIIAIAAKYTPDTVYFLAHRKNTKAFIIISAGFSEESEEGKSLEEKVVKIVNEVAGSLIGPNCVGVLTPQHHSVFTKPIPKLDKNGCDFISGSGATACFIMEAGIPKGLTFSNVYSVGNSAQMGVEDILKYMDENFDPGKDSKIKLLYFESIEKPDLLLKHASSLIKKGCRIAAIKAGTSEAGSRAASSHTGALSSPDNAVSALFKKAGIVRCFGREDMISIASVFMYPELKGKNIAVITHAGGPAVMITDTLSNWGLSVPPIKGSDAESLKNELFSGSSVANPIDFLATGTAEQLGTIIDYVDQKFDHIDAMVVIFGTPGLSKIHDVYEMLDQKIRSVTKPIFPVLPSTLTAKEEVEAFVSKGHVYFPDEVTLGMALSRVFYTREPKPGSSEMDRIDYEKVRKIINACDDGFIAPERIQGLLDAVCIPRVKELTFYKKANLLRDIAQLTYPLVMKVIGPVHKSDVGGVSLNIEDEETVILEFERMMEIKDAKGVLFQPMLGGYELYAGIKKEGKFGHLIMFGLGGIFIEVFKDVRSVLAPLHEDEIIAEIKQLRSYKLFEGARGKTGIDEMKFADIIMRLSKLVLIAPEIVELDLNPIMAEEEKVTVVDARIKIEK